MKRKIFKIALLISALAQVAMLVLCFVQIHTHFFTNGLALNIPLLVVVAGIITATITDPNN